MTPDSGSGVAMGGLLGAEGVLFGREQPSDTVKMLTIKSSRDILVPRRLRTTNQHWIKRFFEQPERVSRKVTKQASLFILSG